MERDDTMVDIGLPAFSPFFMGSPQFLAHQRAPGHQQVLPLPPEFIAPQDGAEKQDCHRHASAVAHLRPIFLGDDLFAYQPIAVAIPRTGAVEDRERDLQCPEDQQLQP